MNDRDFMIYYKKELRRLRIIMLVGVGLGTLLMIYGVAQLLLVFLGD